MEVRQEAPLDPYRWQKAYHYKRYQEDAEYRRRMIEKSSARIKEKYRTDPEWREARLKQKREAYHRDKARKLAQTDSQRESGDVENTELAAASLGHVL
jgi:hypothetical protein